MSWPIAFAVPVAGVTITLLAVSSLLSSLAVPGVVAVIAAAAPPRIRAQTFSCFGLALSVCGAASAPILIGLLSDTLQRNGFSDADALRWSMCGLVAVVMTLGTFLIVQASRHAEADVNADNHGVPRVVQRCAQITRLDHDTGPDLLQASKAQATNAASARHQR